MNFRTERCATKPSDPFLLTQEDFNSLFDSSVEFAMSLLKDKPTSIAPQIAALTLDKKTMERGIITICIECDFNDADKKHNCMEKMGSKLADDELIVMAATLISEAWLSRQVDKQPRYASDRKETVIIAGMSIDKEFMQILSQPVRREDGEHGPMSPDGEPITTGSAALPLLNSFFAAHVAAWKNKLNINI